MVRNLSEDTKMTPGQEYNEKVRRARDFILDLSRGVFPKCPCSPYGYLMLDGRALQDGARAAYEVMRHIPPMIE